MDMTVMARARASRWRPRPAEMATIASALFVVASALLPSAAGERVDLLVAAAAVIAYSVVWYHVLPPAALGEWRSEVGGSFIQLIGLYTIAVTGGVVSPWFAFYLLPLFATVFSYRPRATALVAAIAAVGLIAIAMALPAAAGSPDATRDAAALRLIELAAIASMAYLLTRAMRLHRAGLIRREDRLREALATTEREAMTDPLTGAHNRRSLEQVLVSVTSRAARDQRPYAILLVDVDGLKALNDRAGHVAGDTVLRLVGRAAMDAVRSYDVVARFGGDEFVVVLHDATDEPANRTAERIEQRFAELLAARPELGASTISIGTATWHPGATPADLLAKADAGMYAAKRARGRVRPSDPRGTVHGSLREDQGSLREDQGSLRQDHGSPREDQKTARRS
jgi:diguanylate cyclase (GGDEF)-like protein